MSKLFKITRLSEYSEDNTFKDEMYKRFSTDPNYLGLNLKIDECPEDIYI